MVKKYQATFSAIQKQDLSRPYGGLDVFARKMIGW